MKKNNNKLIIILIIIIIVLTAIIAILSNKLTKKEVKVLNTNTKEKIQEEEKEQQPKEEINTTTKEEINAPQKEEKVTDNKTTQLEIGYENIVFIEKGEAYIIPIIRSTNIEVDNYYYTKHKVKNLNNTVKKAYLFTLGLDPSETTYFLMEDGSVKKLDISGSGKDITFIAEELVASSKNITEITREGKIVYAIDSTGNKTKIGESLN